MAKHLEIISLPGRSIILLFRIKRHPDILTDRRMDRQSSYIITALHSAVQFGIFRLISRCIWKRMQYVVTVSTGTLMAKAICDVSNHVTSDDLERSLKVVWTTVHVSVKMPVCQKIQHYMTPTCQLTNYRFHNVIKSIHHCISWQIRLGEKTFHWCQTETVITWA